jgi:integrase
MSAILERVAPALISLWCSTSDHDLTSDVFSHLAAGRDEWLCTRWDGSTRIFSWEWGDNVRMCKARGCRRAPVGAAGLCRLCKAAFDLHGDLDLSMWLITHTPAPCVISDGPQKCTVRTDTARCGRPAESLALCRHHYRHWDKAGRLDDLHEWMLGETPFPEPVLCAVDSCLRDRTMVGSAITETLCLYHCDVWWKASLPHDVFPLWAQEQAPTGLTQFDLWLGGLETPIIDEILFSLAADTADGTQIPVESPRTIAEAARQTHAVSLGSLTTASLNTRTSRTLRKWKDRLEVLRADSDTEWLNDSVRLSVVKRSPELGTTLPLGRISQPWLRQMMTDFCRASLVSVTPAVLGRYVAEMGRLSAFLATRQDHGDKPPSLTVKAMDAYVASVVIDTTLKNRPLKPKTIQGRLESIASIITQCQALGLTRRYGLQPVFQVFKRHFPKRAEPSSFEQRAFPDATFRFLLGADDILGERVIDLLRSIPLQEFDGAVAVQTLQLAANFGRRPSELCGLNADRIRLDDGTGQAAILYDNFKSGRKNVWLPIDARSSSAVTDWMALLRGRYPSAALADLALLPAPNSNPNGTKHISANQVAGWFRVWVILLEQAIVIAQLHEATGISVREICQLTSDAFTGLTLITSTGEVDLAQPVAGTLADYRHDLRERFRQERVRDMPLFPCPITGKWQEHPLEAIPSVCPARFDALGSGWEIIAADYASGGIPGGRLGRERINPAGLSMRRFRHTYLQHLVDVGTDIFVVQELADHKNVQITIDSYVQVRNEALREAIDVLNQHRINRFGTASQQLAFIPSATTRDVATNRCDNPKVLKLGTEGCEYDRQCYDCAHYSTDPSYLRDIKSEIMTCRMSLQRLETEGPQRQKPHHIAVLKERLAGWKQTLRTLEAHLDALLPDQREEVLVAAEMVWTFRNRARAGGALSFGSAHLDGHAE